MNNDSDIKFGFLLINKEKGPTSHNIVNQLRRITGVKKIGHAGTLDPLASGVLLLAIGREATKKIDFYSKQDKGYEAVFKLGAVTETYDSESAEEEFLSWIDIFLPKKISIFLKKRNIQKIDRQKIERVLSSFLGEQEQVPPMYSAKKVNGQRLYKLARKGRKIKRKANRIRVDQIIILDFTWPFLKIAVRCSSGTYIRSLARDIGRVLGCGAYMAELQRTSFGDFFIKEAALVNDLNEENWQNFLWQL